jgi:hypothetical protein
MRIFDEDWQMISFDGLPAWRRLGPVAEQPLHQFQVGFIVL